jgi:hypothetical protein
MFNDRIIKLDSTLFYSPLPDEYDSRPAEVYTFIPNNHSKLTEELNKYSNELYYKDSHRLLDNYKFLDFYKFPIVSMLKRENKIVGFATGYVRDWYPLNSIRLFNRFYHDNTSSRIKFTRELLRPTTYNCLVQQVEMAKILNYDMAFISREIRAIKFFENFINAINSYTENKWEFKKGPFLLTPDKNDLKSWQAIGYTKLKESDNNFWEHWKCK